MLDPASCRARQKRFWEHAPPAPDIALITRARHVYYFTGHLTSHTHEAAAVLRRDGHTTLITPNRPIESAAVDQAEAYTANEMGTMHPDREHALAKALAAHCVETHVGIEPSIIASLMKPAVPVWIHKTIETLRRRKDADELAIMRRAIAATGAMYERAREIIEPGVDEFDVFVELSRVAMLSIGAPMSAPLGNDFACGCGGGPARKGRKAKAGELYILDLGPACFGYFADNSRAIAVDRNPTYSQKRAHEAILDVLDHVEKHARPGVRCRDMFDAADQHLKRCIGVGMTHHLGHGVGLEAHEAPRLNPFWDDTLEVGDVFTAEPGVYGEHLGGGMRIENQYLVTETGVENLTPFLLALT